MTTLIINPEEGHTSGPDEANWYIVPYFEQVRDIVASRNQPYTYLYKEQAVRTNIWDSLAKEHPHTIVAVGHGSSSMYTAYRLDPVFWVDMNVEKGFDFAWTSGTVMLMLSCLTAISLGPYMVKNGALAYIGWTEEYVFVAEYGIRKQPNSIDQIFLKPIEVAFSRTAVGDITPKECRDYIYRKYYESLSLLAPHERDALVNDMVNLTLLPKPPTPPTPLALTAVGMVSAYATQQILKPKP